MRLRSTRLFAPLLAAVLLAVGLFGGGLTLSASAQDDFQTASHGARITVHNAVCDSEVWDIFGECHDDRLDNVAFSVAGVRRWSDANGVVSWTPGAGTRTIIQDARVFDTYEGAYVFCSNEATGAVLFDGPIDVNRVTITTTAGQGVVCDWYNLQPDETSDVTLTLYKAACPPGYDGDDYYADCYDNPRVGVEFATYNQKSNFEANGTTDGNGLVAFQLPGDLAGNLVNVTEVPLVEAPDGGEPPFAVYCTRNAGRPVDFYISQIQLDPGGDAFNVEINGIVAGDHIHCDWFNLT